MPCDILSTNCRNKRHIVCLLKPKITVCISQNLRDHQNYISRVKRSESPKRKPFSLAQDQATPKMQYQLIANIVIRKKKGKKKKTLRRYIHTQT